MKQSDDATTSLGIIDNNNSNNIITATTTTTAATTTTRIKNNEDVLHPRWRRIQSRHTPRPTHHRDLRWLYLVLGLLLSHSHSSSASFCLPPSTIASGDNLFVSSSSSSSSSSAIASQTKKNNKYTIILPGLRTKGTKPPQRRGVYTTRAYLARTNTPWFGGNKDGEGDDNNNKNKEENKNDGTKNKNKNSPPPSPNTNKNRKGSTSEETKTKVGKFGRIVSAVGNAVRRTDGGDETKSSKASSSKAKGSLLTRFTTSRKDNELPTDVVPPDGRIDIAIASIEEKLASVRNELSSLRLNNEDAPPPPVEKETNRLDEIRKNLEERRQQLLEEDRKRREERQAEKEAKAERQREQKEVERKEKAERERKERAERGRKAKKNKKAGVMMNGGTGTALVPDEKGNATGVVMEAFTGAQSYVSSAWESTLAKRAKWIPVCQISRISPGEVVPVVAGGLDLLIVASKDGLKVHCIANSCPHLGTPLEIGPLERRKIDNKIIGPEKRTRTGGLPTTKQKVFPPSKDGCEECIVCPLHQTAFALESGEVRGEWCPYPPILGKLIGSNKPPDTKLPTFELRTRGKDIEVRINSNVDDLYKNK